MVRPLRCPTCDRIIRDIPRVKAPAGMRMTRATLISLYAVADEFDAASPTRYTARDFVDYFAPDVTHIRRHA